MTENIIERVKRADVDDVCFAFPFTVKPADVAFRDLAHKTGIAYCCPEFVGESDLVGWYMAASLVTHAKIIVRVPGDNPCIDPAFIDKAVRVYMRGGYLFYTNTTDKVEGFGYVDGIGAEVLSADTLALLDRVTVGSPVYREHPHKWFEDNFPESKLPKAALRLDVNTQEDYDFIKGLYDHIGHNRFTTNEAVEAVSELNRCRN